MKKKLLAAFLALALVFSLLPTWAIAEGDETDVAQIENGDSYATLAAAVAAATDGQTVKLLSDVELLERVDITKAVTLDLNGYTVKPADRFASITSVGSSVNWETGDRFGPTSGSFGTGSGSGVFGIHRGGELTITDSSNSSSGKIDANMKTMAAVSVTVKGETATGTPAKLTVENGTLKGSVYGVVTNGTRHDTVITVKGGKIESKIESSMGFTGPAIYHPNKGEIYISGGTLTGYDALAIKGGSPVEITGGTFIAGGQKDTPAEASNSGVNNVGSALYVEGNYAHGAEVKISGGEFKTTDPNAPAVRSLFNTEPKATISITGGTFSSDVTEYVADNYKCTGSGTSWTVTANEGYFKAEIEGGSKYTSLADAIKAAQSGATIKLLDDVTNVGKILLPAGVTLDGNNKKITGNSDIDIKNAGCTVKNVVFEDIHNDTTITENDRAKYSLDRSTGNLTAIYTHNVTGNVTIENCTFDNIDWDAIQVNAVAGTNAVITGNTFKHTADEPAIRYVHVQSAAKDVDFSATVTGNKFYNCGKLAETGIEVYYPTNAENVDCSGNYMDAPMAVCIGTGNSFNNAYEKAFPFKNENLTSNVVIAITVFDTDDNTYFYPTEEDAIAAGVVAKIGNMGYKSLAKAIEAAEAGDTVTLLNDVELTERIGIAKKVTLDLNGKTISAVKDKTKFSNPTSAVIGVMYDGDLTIEDSVGGGMIDSENVQAAISMTLKGDEKGDKAAAKLTVNGGTLKGYYYGIVGNGTRQDTVIVVNGGTIMGATDDSAGIYNPQRGTLTVNGGTIEGSTGIYTKSGEVVTTIDGGVIRGTGTKQNYTPCTNGFQSTGDALVLDNCGYPGGAPNADIQGGTFESTYGSAVGSYAAANYNAIAGFISGGTFNTTLDEALLAEGYKQLNSGTVVEDTGDIAVTTDDGKEVDNEDEKAAADVVINKIAEQLAPTGAVAGANETAVASVEGVEKLEVKQTAMVMTTTGEGGTATHAVKSITFDVTPKNGETKVTELANDQKLTFQLPVPDAWASLDVKVEHTHGSEETVSFAKVQGEDGNHYVSLTSGKFSYYSLTALTPEELEEELGETDYVAMVAHTDGSVTYYSYDYEAGVNELYEAIMDAIANDAKLELLDDVRVEESDVTRINQYFVEHPGTAPFKVKWNDDYDFTYRWNYESGNPAPYTIVDAPVQATITLVTPEEHTEDYHVGETVTVTPTMSGNSYDGVYLKVTYDSEYLQLTNGDGWYETTTGEVKFFDYDGVAGDELPALTFTVIKADPTQTSITALVSVADSQYSVDSSSVEPYSFAATNATISIASIEVDLPTPTEATYTGAQISTDTLTNTGYTVSGTDYDSVKDMLSATNVGEYSVTLTLADYAHGKYKWPAEVPTGFTDNNDGTATYTVLTITQGTNEITNITVDGDNVVAFGNTEYSTAVTAIWGAEDATFEYATWNGTEAPTSDDGLSLTNAKPTNAGKYAVKVTILGTGNYNAVTGYGTFEIQQGTLKSEWFTLTIKTGGPATGSAQEVLGEGAKKTEIAPDPLNVTFQYAVTEAVDSEETPDEPVDGAWVEYWEQLKVTEQGTYNVWIKVTDTDGNYETELFNMGTFTLEDGQYTAFLIKGYLNGSDDAKKSKDKPAKDLILVFAAGDLGFTYNNIMMYDVTGMGYQNSFDTINGKVSVEGSNVTRIGMEEVPTGVNYTKVYAYLVSGSAGDLANVKMTSNKGFNTISTFGTGDNAKYDVNENGSTDVGDASSIYNINQNGTAATTLIAKALLADTNRDGKIDLLENSDVDPIRNYFITGSYDTPPAAPAVN